MMVEKNPWTKDMVVMTIQSYHLSGISLKFRAISQLNSELRKKAEQFFGTWGEAIAAAGLDYEEIKKNNSGGSDFVSEDGAIYPRQSMGLIANSLYKLKSENRIYDYKNNYPISHNIKLLSDFAITLNNGAMLYMEVDDLFDKDTLKEKIDYHKKINSFHCKVSASSNVPNIIERFNTWFSLPEKPCIITGHKEPDGDSLSSSVALYRHYERKGVKCALKISGKVQKNLMWMLDDVDVVKKVPDWAEMIFILDCAPVKTRIGWDLPNLPIYNIDHHKTRLKDNDPDNGIHVLDACSTSGILCSRFGLKEEILSVGIYTDKKYTKKVYEAFYFISILNMSDDSLEKYISMVQHNSDRKIWVALQEAKPHVCRNGFAIVELKDDYDASTIEDFMQVLFKLYESVCLIYGTEQNVKLRTSNINIDVGKVAKEFDGGGHPYASGCNASGRISELRNKIKSLDIPRLEENNELEERKRTNSQDN